MMKNMQTVMKALKPAHFERFSSNYVSLTSIDIHKHKLERPKPKLSRGTIKKMEVESKVK